MERLVDKIVPDEADIPVSSYGQPQEARRSFSGSLHGDVSTERRAASVDVLDTAAADDGPIAALLAMRHEPGQRGLSESGNASTPALTSVEPAKPPTGTGAVTSQGARRRPGASSEVAHFSSLNRHFWVCNALRNVVPPQAAVDAILAASLAAPYVVAMCYSEAERRQERCESISSISVSPSSTVHPLHLAKRALQILICIQQLPPSFDWEILGIDTSMIETMNRLLNTTTLVTSNDELIGYSEGIECLIYQGFYQANGGNLRRAWITARRTLSLAQMMGLDKKHPIAFRSCDPSVKTRHRTSPGTLLSKVVSWERYLSLLLGLPTASQGIVLPGMPGTDCPIDGLERAHAALSARISERNSSYNREPDHHLKLYALTQEIDLELEASAKYMPPEWWDAPHLDSFADEKNLWDTVAKTLAQIHHYTLVLLLHVSYMMRDTSSPRYDYSKTTCLRAARELLIRFLMVRTHSVSAYSCRRVDYAGLIASMTLCLSYLARRQSEVWEYGRIRDDVLLIDSVRSRMEHISRASGDRLSREAVAIIDQLAPIIAKAGPVDADLEVQLSGQNHRRGSKQVHFSVPFMGAVSIRMPYVTEASCTDWQGGHRRHPSSATGALERMAIDPPAHQQNVTEKHVTNDREYSEAGSLHFAPLTPLNDDVPLHSAEPNVPEWDQQPDFMADGEDWALQGVDAAYWSLFEGFGTLT